jgi:glutathione peroxidase
MIKIFLIISSFFITATAYVESVYTYSITTIEGESKSLSAYEGKKILVLTLPIIQNSFNDPLLHSLDSLRAAYTSSLVIIAAPSYEDGYTAENKNALKTWYRSILGNGIIITDGLYSRKTSGNLQHPLFKWLTDKDRNGHFNQDVTGPKNKFVIWQEGRLMGVLAAETRLGGHTINKLLQ